MDDIPGFDENIDRNTFDQILEMDEPDDREFSAGIVFGFFDQAETTFEEIESALYVFSSLSSCFLINV
ncbi:hypothetical protein DV737_g3473, partial [Chaetothyriales sp. CBS 132003]